MDEFNHRQVGILKHALSNPGHRYTCQSHQNSHQISLQTARTDLYGLVKPGLLHQLTKGKNTCSLPLKI
jgi:Fic family protein